MEHFEGSTLTLPPDMPKVIAVGGLKGGIGKSTLSVFVAFVYAIIYGKRVLLVDADPSSQTSYDWWELAKAKGTPLPFDLESWSNDRVGSLVASRTPGKYDVVVIDCGGHSDAVLSSAVTVSNFVLLATTPFKADVRRIAATFKSAAQAAQSVGRVDDISATVVFLRVDNRQEAKNEAMKDAVEQRLPVLGAQVSYRPAVYADAFEEGPPPRKDLEEVQEILLEAGALEEETKETAA